ncbi:MAG TPA: type 4a pilus biogenesis protein PilO [Gemmatimonadaceae bacterium]
MALLPTNRRDQVFALIGLMALAAAGVFYMYVWAPKKTELDTSQARLDTLQVINQRAKSELAQGKTAQLKAEADKYAQDLTVMRQLVPTSNEVPALLEQVSTAARRVGLEIADVQPLPTMAGDQYEAYKYRLSVRGGYNQIGQFLASVGSLQRIIAPINLTLAPLSIDAKTPRAARTQPLDARFEIETYVARTAPPAPTKDAGAKPAGAAQ